ncbi:hypothetical protein, partial [Actinomadura soli]|uniref:hypothetical protein n=1 Tax=Actinomadura soli TaxID=2508997 RepID=UPI00197A8605
PTPAQHSRPIRHDGRPAGSERSAGNVRSTGHDRPARRGPVPPGRSAPNRRPGLRGPATRRR